MQRLLSWSWWGWPPTDPSRAISSLAFWRDCWEGLALPPLGRVSLPLHPAKVLTTFCHQTYMKRFYGWNIEKWRCQELLGCPNAWISVMRRTSSKSKVISCQRSSRTNFSSLTWLMPCTRHLSLQCCPRPLSSLVAAGYHPPQVSQRTVDLSQRNLDQRGLNQRRRPPAPQRPVNRSRSKSLRLWILTQTRPVSLLQRRNCLVKVPKSRSPVDCGNMAARPWQAAPKMVPLSPR